MGRLLPGATGARRGREVRDYEGGKPGKGGGHVRWGEVHAGGGAWGGGWGYN